MKRRVPGLRQAQVSHLGIVIGWATVTVADRYQRRAGTPSAVSVTSGVASSSASVTVALTPATTVARYGYPGHNDNSQFTRNTSGDVADFAIALPGNTTYVWSSAGFDYSHANLHGDTITVTNQLADRVWTGYNGPYGEQASATTPTNTNVDGTHWGWHGQQQRLTDRDIIHMGARPYSPTHGRFLAVDPIEGGCANDYTYVYGDPVGENDLSGNFCILGRNPNGSCRGSGITRRIPCVAGSLFTPVPTTLEGALIELGGTGVGLGTSVLLYEAGMAAAGYGSAALAATALGVPLIIVGGGLLITGLVLLYQACD